MLQHRADRVSFRAQLVLPEQRQLFDYWIERAQGLTLPKRCDINPVHFPKLLPGVSLIDIEDDVGHSRVRLAGTRLRDVFDREITGLRIDQLDVEERRDYWITAYRHMVANRLPTQGILRGPLLHKQHLVQYWLKLPLSKAGDEKVAMILCLDTFIPSVIQPLREKFALPA